MTERTAPKLMKWPFLIGDLLLVGFAVLLVFQAGKALDLWQNVLCIICVGTGAWLGVTPFLREYDATVKLLETDALTTASAQIQNLELVASQIAGATAQWQTVQEHSARTVQASKEIAERMAVEAQAFSQFLQKANDSERVNLRLEVEKLRRSEGEWLQIVTRLLDHVHALFQAASRSGQRGLIEQLGHFQNACRDVVRRVGLVPFSAAANEPFDAKIHQLADTDVQPPADSRIAEVLATGYTYQGQLLRRALVAIQPAAPVMAQPLPATEPSLTVEESVGETLEEVPAAKPEEPQLF